uniref:Transmembrane protein n=1 Tax=Chromera velia CCMP2878 TaxID=1169474 RepID=A0A0G4F1X6_9ALVE|eukprot:Cvel_14568.t1-p1 / transcript=Cvel_14568.t1 / gene=Cvel_14568 / organism=Chromera_velia_CCMP2878 / gene_product=hypothetical protein / transcript_product=hypothetical protein / location=Cvel_scaffold1041:26343-29099(-) / protein_length=141 / sequence_SO=supercontig / SO=protein_coding / is_pseudo=false
MVALLLVIHAGRRLSACSVWPFRQSCKSFFGLLILAAGICETASLAVFICKGPSCLTLARVVGWEALCLTEELLVFFKKRGDETDHLLASGSSSMWTQRATLRQNNGQDEEPRERSVAAALDGSRQGTDGESASASYERDY